MKKFYISPGMIKQLVMKKSKPWVFIIEDDISIIKAYIAKFKYEKIPLKVAEDGDKAIEVLKHESLPCVILLDLMLPKKNGFEVLEIIKKDPRLKEIPVLIFTNLGQEVDRKKGEQLGVVEYLVKANTKIDDVVHKVNRYIKKYGDESG